MSPSDEFPYVLSERAQRDLRDIANRIAFDNPAAAIRVIDALLNTIKFLAQFSSVGLVRDDLRPGLRVFPAQKPAQSYVILFRQLPFGIQIVTISHGARDLSKLAESDDL
ncbi:MAG: type II toxin-antitoxin system RelE/ParE family toxin [Planctomycetaceae bacterium]|nr:type II toxin-antitoxin system RelE/ParE family toxin [Planctomycetaceae bacterium]